jgi:hypothetical protein
MMLILSLVELQGQVNVIRNNSDYTLHIEREVYMMGYVVKRLDRLQKSLTQKIEAESSTNDA